jgi:hypothetical protein
MDQPSPDTSHSIKVAFRTPEDELDIRRINVQKSITFQELDQLLHNMFQLETTTEISLQYRDNELDLINITSDLELMEAFFAKKGAILKLELAGGTPKPIEVKICESSQEIGVFDDFNRFVATINAYFEKNAEIISAALPNPKMILEQLKPIFESFLNDPSASAKKKFQSFVQDIDELLAEIDLWMHQKSSKDAEPKPSSERNEQFNAESILRPFRELYEKILNDTQSFLQDLNDWLEGMDLWVGGETEPTPEVKVHNPFDQQIQELRKMGFLNDDQNLAVLMQNKGDLLSAVLMLLDSESAS